MNAFAPSITHSPLVASWVALVRVPPASVPASGSVSPNAPSARPAQRSGSQRCCCSGVPKAWIGLAPRPTPASRVMAIDWSTRASSSIATHSPVRSPPPPPTDSGNGMPNNPSSPIAQHGGDRETRGCDPTRRRGARSRRRRTHAPARAARRARRSTPASSATGSHLNQRSATSAPNTPHAATTARWPHSNPGASTSGLNTACMLWENGFRGKMSPITSSHRGASVPERARRCRTRTPAAG